MTRPTNAAAFYDGRRAECFNDIVKIRPGFRDVAGLESPAVERDAELFYTGNWKGRDYTHQDLRDMRDSFTAPASLDEWDVPVQADHSDSVWDTMGSLRKVWLEDDDTRLCGTLMFVGEEAVKRAKDGRVKKLSLGVYLEPKRAIREASATPFPHLARARVFSEGGPTPMPDTDTQTAGQQQGAAAAATPPPAPKTEDEKKKEEAAAQAASAATTTPAPAPAAAAHSQSDPAIERMQAEFRKTQAQLQQMIEREHFRECKDLVESFASAGKTVPAFAEQELAFVRSLSNDQVAVYKQLKEKQPRFVEFGAKTVPGKASCDGDQDTADKTKANDLANKYGPKKK